ncbi:Holliday junction branch migration protein RuvA [uncultured Mailhella sp.]|uniref:Holliday junction branch migration protein RuvA n=1 Tax=uncultured Mailhella sp. TaxID=1981031 RepID=UPI0025F35A29|nr:Holliday junction branch migration protein RuvA [uncultured Mailhella sp.]
MLAYMEGRVLERTENSCVLVTAGGTGYEIFLPEHALAQLPAQGGTASFYTSFIVREDAQELFGFPSWDERQTFNLLTGINRVGARTALAILSRFRPDDLRRIVAEDDAAALTQVSGIGKKTAQQIFLELKYKLKGESSVSLAAAVAGRPSVYRDALTGLANLGYDEDTAGQVLRKVLENDPELDVGEALRAALKALAGGKK